MMNIQKRIFRNFELLYLHALVPNATDLNLVYSQRFHISWSVYLYHARKYPIFQPFQLRKIWRALAV